jgi:hypothetical protein
MTSHLIGFLLIVAILTASPSIAGSGSDQKADTPSAWSRFWQGVADDWKKIGKDAKESGTEAGWTVKEEVQNVPDNFRKGFEEAKEDFKKATGSTEEPGPDN